MYLGMALYKLSDIDNAVAAYDKAISLGPADPLLHLNYGKRALIGWVVPLWHAIMLAATCKPYAAARSEHCEC
jgi:hypothetical protein